MQRKEVRGIKVNLEEIGSKDGNWFRIMCRVGLRY
jgi:hypothetical protein